MIVNGQTIKLDKTRPLSEVLALCGYDQALVAVLVNDQVAPRNQFALLAIQDSDDLEVVAFVGGG
ncbi:MAG: sulfur carrier protein ThiS [Deltaproteobacteria bacterium]|jgi:sulfur carrier protein|nr:sulfur carrier protein ThiS [Deltaproteobacteria bacterium]